MAIQWRIYYEDGSTFSNEDGTLQEAPAFGVMCVVCEAGSIEHPEHWGCGDFVGLIDYLARSGLVKFGRTTTNQIYDSVLKQARDNPDMGKSRIVLERGDYYWFNG